MLIAASRAVCAERRSIELKVYSIVYKYILFPVQQTILKGILKLKVLLLKTCSSLSGLEFE